MPVLEYSVSPSLLPVWHAPPRSSFALPSSSTARCRHIPREVYPGTPRGSSREQATLRVGVLVSRQGKGPGGATAKAL